MEYRHIFSDPRPVYGCGQLTWNVDVFREGVDDPVFTLDINEETMPPRMRKKKAVWRLPEDQESLPKFGTDEKKRLLDLFKAQKKNRRKSKKGAGANPDDDSPDLIKEEDAFKAKEKGKKEMAEEKKEDRGGNPAGKRSHVAEKRLDSKARDRPLVAPPPGMTPSDKEIASPRLQNPSTMTSRGDSRIHPSPPPSSPPPGFSVSPANLQTNPGLFFTAPFTSENIPVELAQTFMDAYYSSMTHGQQEELLLYYVPGAVKSLSLGGAHSFCKSRQEILVQLNSLQGSLWDVSGVVAQEGFMDSVVLLLTGNALPKTSPKPLAFSHSITLVKSAQGYQIHNDAMSLMTPGR